MSACAKVGCGREGAWQPQLIVFDDAREVVVVLPFQVCDEHRDPTLVHHFAASFGDRVSEFARQQGVAKLEWSRARMKFVHVT